MGCGVSNASGVPNGAHTKSGKDDSPCGPIEAKVRSHPRVKVSGSYYCLRQSFAFIRHGDRLDHTKDWQLFPDREKWPNDTPLTREGHEHAKQVGEALKKNEVKFDLIISSPYFRCAQTACRIAQVLNLPIHFDVDLGEIFDEVSMKGEHLEGKPQYRSPADLEAQLRPDFPDVDWVRDKSGLLKVEGKLQAYPEDFECARMRYAYKTKKLVQQAASELMSILIVSHGDGVASVIGMMREDWEVNKVGYCAYFVATRDVKVLAKGTEQILKEESVYAHPESWHVTCGKGLHTSKIRNAHDRKEAHQHHKEEMKAMELQSVEIKTDYVLDDDQVERFKMALSNLGASDGDKTHLLGRAATSHHLAKDRGNRVLCSPHSQHSLEG